MASSSVPAAAPFATREHPPGTPFYRYALVLQALSAFPAAILCAVVTIFLAVVCSPPDGWFYFDCNAALASFGIAVLPCTVAGVLIAQWRRERGPGVTFGLEAVKTVMATPLLVHVAHDIARGVSVVQILLTAVVFLSYWAPLVYMFAEWQKHRAWQGLARSRSLLSERGEVGREEEEQQDLDTTAFLARLSDSDASL